MSIRQFATCLDEFPVLLGLARAGCTAGNMTVHGQRFVENAPITLYLTKGRHLETSENTLLSYRLKGIFDQQRQTYFVLHPKE